MREKDRLIDRTKHKVYSKNAKKCVLKLLHRYYDEKHQCISLKKDTVIR